MAGSKKQQTAKAIFARVSEKKDDTIITNAPDPVEGKTQGQRSYIKGLNNGDDLILALGPAGTGKTYLAVAKAVELLLSQKAKKIILSRPAVGAGEDLGFLPGAADDKIAPYVRPLHDALKELYGKASYKESVEIAPVSFLRGRTLKDCVVVIDEAQNCTMAQLKMIATRMGANCKMFIVGDPEQSDLEPGQSGLADFVKAMEHDVRGIGIHRLTNKDVVRHPVVGRVLDNLAVFNESQASIPNSELSNVANLNPSGS